MELPNTITSDAQVYEHIQRVQRYEDLYTAIEHNGRKVIIKVNADETHEDSYTMSREEAGVYLLRGLRRFIYQNEEGQSIRCFVYGEHERLETWMHRGENAVRHGSFTKNLLQILRDVCRGMDYLFSSNRFHGGLRLSSIAVVTDLRGNCRGKLTDMKRNGSRLHDCISIKNMIVAILNHFRHQVDEGQYLEMEYLSCMFKGLATNSPNNQRAFWSCVNHYPLFLDANTRNLLRISLYKALDYIVKPEFVCDNILFIKYGSPYKWYTRVHDPDFKVVLNHDYYSDSAFCFIKFCRHSIMPLEENRLSSRSMDDVDRVLSDLWPGFLGALFNQMVFSKKEILVSQRSLH